MRRVVPLLLASLAMTACGAGETVGGGPASTEAAEEPTVSSEPGELESPLPPPVVLVSEAGRQTAVQGTYCVDGPSVGTCADYAENGPPEELSIVRPAEAVELVVEGAQTAAGSASARVLWCEKEIASVQLAGPTTAWTIDLEPGMYELELFATFEAGETSGDTSVSLGLLVDPTAPLEIMPRPDSIAGCTTE